MEINFIVVSCGKMGFGSLILGFLGTSIIFVGILDELVVY